MKLKKIILPQFPSNQFIKWNNITFWEEIGSQTEKWKVSGADIFYRTFVAASVLCPALPPAPTGKQRQRQQEAAPEGTLCSFLKAM